MIQRNLKLLFGKLMVKVIHPLMCGVGTLHLKVKLLFTMNIIEFVNLILEYQSMHPQSKWVHLTVLLWGWSTTHSDLVYGYTHFKAKFYPSGYRNSQVIFLNMLFYLLAHYL